MSTSLRKTFVINSVLLVSILCSAQTGGSQPRELGPEPSDPVLRSIRTARSVLFDDSGFEPVLERNVQARAPLTLVHRPTLPELPVANSDFIAIASITDAAPFLSRDRRAIYTEYTLEVTEVLKAAAGSATAGKRVALVEFGGIARVADSRIVKHDVRGYGILPAIGGQYLFFLKYYPAGDCFRLVKSWRLVHGHVAAQSEDDLNRTAQHRSTFHGVAEAKLIDAVRESVRQSGL